MIGALSCSSPDIQLKVEEIKDGLVRVSIHNHTQTDFTEMTFVLSYFDNKKELLKTDTVSYHVKEGNFLSAKGSTFIVQAVPERTSSTQVKVLP